MDTCASTEPSKKNVENVDDPCTRLQKDCMYEKSIVDHVDERCARLKTPKSGHGVCDQSYKINTINPAITSLYTNMFI